MGPQAGGSRDEREYWLPEPEAGEKKNAMKT